MYCYRNSTHFVRQTTQISIEWIRDCQKPGQMKMAFLSGCKKRKTVNYNEYFRSAFAFTLVTLFAVGKCVQCVNGKIAFVLASLVSIFLNFFSFSTLSVSVSGRLGNVCGQTEDFRRKKPIHYLYIGT